MPTQPGKRLYTSFYITRVTGINFNKKLRNRYSAIKQLSFVTLLLLVSHCLSVHFLLTTTTSQIIPSNVWIYGVVSTVLLDDKTKATQIQWVWFLNRYTWWSVERKLLGVYHRVHVQTVSTFAIKLQISICNQAPNFKLQSQHHRPFAVFRVKSWTFCWPNHLRVIFYIPLATEIFTHTHKVT